jgi:hypothetical protein
MSDEEVATIIRAIDDYKLKHPTDLKAGSKGVSVHENSSLGVTDLVSIYEPRSRIEINSADIPKEVARIIETAFFRRIEDVRRAFPEAIWPQNLTYVEYGPGQYFTAHVDGMIHDQVAGFGVTLTDDFEGGEFYVETCGSSRAWVEDRKAGIVARGAADMSSEWFRSTSRTRWTMRPKKGLAVFYGSGLVHGSLPVTRGSLRKVLAFIKVGQAP